MFEENQLMCAQEMGRAYYHVITMIRRNRETATGKFMLQQGNGHYILMVPTKVIKSD